MVTVETLDHKTFEVDTTALSRYSTTLAKRISDLNGANLTVDIRSLHMQAIVDYLKQYPDPSADIAPEKPLPPTSTIASAFKNKWDQDYIQGLQKQGVSAALFMDDLRNIKFDEVPLLDKIGAWMAIDLYKYGPNPKDIQRAIKELGGLDAAIENTKTKDSGDNKTDSKSDSKTDDQTPEEPEESQAAKEVTPTSSTPTTPKKSRAKKTTDDVDELANSTSKLSLGKKKPTASA